MSPGIVALLAEQANPSHCSTQQAKAMLGPLEDLVSAARMQVAADQSLVRKAELDPEFNPELAGKLALLRRENASLAAAIEAASAPFERLTDQMARRDKVLAEFREVVTTRDSYR